MGIAVEQGQKVQISSYKMNESWRCMYSKHDDYSK